MKEFTLRKIETGGLLIIEATSLTALRKRFPAEKWEEVTPEPESEDKELGYNQGDGREETN